MKKIKVNQIKTIFQEHIQQRGYTDVITSFSILCVAIIVIKTIFNI